MTMRSPLRQEGCTVPNQMTLIWYEMTVTLAGNDSYELCPLNIETIADCTCFWIIGDFGIV
jgi:hypothetical protein